MKNIFELAEEEKQKKLVVEAAIAHILRTDKTRMFIASRLYEAAYSDEWALRLFTTGEDTPPDVVLDRFCQIIYGGSFKEVIETYDNFLG